MQSVQATPRKGTKEHLMTHTEEDMRKLAIEKMLPVTESTNVKQISPQKELAFHEARFIDPNDALGERLKEEDIELVPYSDLVDKDKDWRIPVMGYGPKTDTLVYFWCFPSFLQS
jgi:hypothetical protein